MKKFIIKVLLFFCLCSLLDIMVGYASTSLQNSSKGGLTQKDEFIKSKMDADIVIMGSSRASHHYVSNLMADSLGCTVYNAGMDGKGIIMNYGVLLEITDRYTPKTIIYDLMPAYDWILGDNEQYLAHLRHAYDIKGIDSIFWNVNPNERIKMMSNSYRANSLVPHLIYDNIIAHKDTLNGYIPLLGIYRPQIGDKGDTEVFKVDGNQDSIDPIKVKLLNRFINLCKEKNINLIFSFSPIFQSSEDMATYGKNFAKSNEIRMLDFREMGTSFKDTALYQDNSHLNNTGAQLYTLEVVEVLRNE